MGIDVEVGGVNTNGMTQKRSNHIHVRKNKKQHQHKKHSLHESIPACNSYDCKNKSADGVYHDPVVADAVDPDYYHYYDDRYNGPNHDAHA